MSRRRQRRTRKNRVKRSELGWVGLALAVIVAATVGSLLGDALGFNYGLVGSFIWLFFLLASFFVLLLYFAQFVLPLNDEGEVWLEGLEMIWRHYRLRGKLFLNHLGKPPAEDPPAEGALPISFKKLQAGFVPSHQALAIGRGNQYTRAAGPGFVVLAKGEQVKATVDLRPHVRTQPIKANTRDGIPIETTVTVVFQVQRPESPAKNEKRPFPYNREAIFHITYLYSVDEADKMQVWTEQVCPRAAALVIGQLARYPLDKLYNSQQNGRLQLKEIGVSVRQELIDTWLGARGIDLIAVSIGHIQPPEQIKEQRIRSWQAGWERKIKVHEGVRQGEVLRRMKLKRAQAQIEIINNITESIDAMRHIEDTELSEIIMLRMIEVLEETAQDAVVRKLFPEQALTKLVVEASSEMRQLLSGSHTISEEETADL